MLPIRIINFFFPLCVLFLIFSNFCEASASNPVPIPPGEQSLNSSVAENWITVSPENDILEGAIFDDKGNLLFCDVSKRKIMRLTPRKELSMLLELPEIGAGGLAFHSDGRLFMAALDLEKGVGGVLAWSPDSGRLETIVPLEAGYWPNDLVFAKDGGFYFSNFRGRDANPAGGIYHVSADFRKITPVIPNLDQANGVALSPDGRLLWATEFAQNRLHRALLADSVAISPIGAGIPYHFTGVAPDSMRVDTDGNVYVAIYGQGRIMIFNNLGIPVGQILLPGREKGQNLLSTSLAISPDNRDLFIVTSNEEAALPARIFKSRALSSGQKPLNRGK